MAAVRASITIVMIGSFTPADFLPSRLADAKVLSTNDADSASYVALLPNQVVHFTFNWGELLVAGDRLQLSVMEPPYIRAVDFVLKALNEVSPKSIVTSFGINTDCHYDLQSADARNAFGVRMAPTGPWGAWGTRIAETMKGPQKGTRLQGGALLLQMHLPFADDECKIYGHRNVAVGPSTVITTNTGVQFQSNHHHQAVPTGEDNGDRSDKPLMEARTNALLTALHDRFESSVDEGFAIFEEALKS